MEKTKKTHKRKKSNSGNSENKSNEIINKHFNSIHYKSLNNQKTISKTSLTKLKNNKNIIEINRKKMKFKNNLKNHISLDEIKRNISYNNSNITNKKLQIVNTHSSPNVARKIDKTNLFIHNKKNKSKNEYKKCPHNTSRDIVNYVDYLSINKSNKDINKVSFNVDINKSEKNSVQKKININLPNQKNKYKFFTSNSNNNITERSERETFQIREIPTMMLINKINESDVEIQNSETYNNFILKSIYKNKNYFKSKINPIIKHKIFPTKTKCLNDKILIKKDANNNKNNIDNFNSNENLLKKRINSDNNNLKYFSTDSKQNKLINLSKKININKKTNKSIASISEIQKYQLDNSSKSNEILLKNKNNKKNIKAGLLFNRSKDFSNNEINNLIDIWNNYQEHNGILKIIKTPKKYGKIEIQKKLKNDTPRQNIIKFNWPHSKKNITYRFSYIAAKNINNKKLIEDKTEEVEEIETFDNSIQLHDQIHNCFNSKRIIYNNIMKIILTQHKLIKNIIRFCDQRTLNMLCLLSKNYYNVLKIFIYEKIKNKILKYNKKESIYENNKIKNSLFKYSQLSEMSKILLQKKYTDLLYENNCKYDEEIKKDLTRTFPENYSFQYGNSNYNKLYHILTAYSNYNKKIGYAQGLNFLAANCIYAFDNEIDEFIFLDALIRKFNLETLLGISNNLKLKLRNFNFFLGKYTPKVNSYLESIALNYDFFTASWMLTLFSSSMDFNFLFCIWDYMIIFGWKFFKCFVVAVIKKFENDILKQPQDSLTFYMKNILRDSKFKENFESIISLTFEYLIKINEIIC